jgi:hypothetical protein
MPPPTAAIAAMATVPALKARRVSLSDFMGVSSLEFEHQGKSYIQLIRAYIRKTPHSASRVRSNIQAIP